MDSTRDLETLKLGGGTATVTPLSFAGGRYRVERVLGEGGQKHAYLVLDTELDRLAVIALLKTESSESARHLRSEAQLMARLGNHQNIVTVFDIGDENGTPFIVSEYVEAGSVDDLLKASEEQTLSIDVAVKIARHVVDALAYAHRRGIIHRDVKPANVWLTPSGIAKLGDFGIATALHLAASTEGGPICGTALYMAPEQALYQRTGPKSDLYSLGVMLYQMLTGRPPFVADNLISVISQHIEATPVRPSFHNPDIPRRLEELILSLLQKQPRDRPESAKAVSKVLASIAASTASPQAVLPAQDATSLARLAGFVFVGRKRELDLLQAAVDRAMDGEGQIILLAGEAGAGKSRLTEQIATYARLREMQPFIGRSLEEGAPAFWPWIQILRAYLETRTSELLKSELRGRAPEIAQLLPEIRNRLRDVPPPPPLEPNQARFGLFDAVCEVFKNAAESAPLLIVLDDLHWADQASLLLLQFVAREVRGSRILVLGTYRESAVDIQPALAGALAELSRAGAGCRLPLSGLTESDIARLIEVAAGITPVPAVVAAVSRTTEGNAFFVNEVVKLLVSEGRLTAAVDSVTIPVPQSVREVVARRMEGLSEPCRRMLTTASVLGRDFVVTELRAVAEIPGDELLEHLDQTVAARILAEDNSAPGRYRFVHTLIRETLYDRLGAGQRARLHRRAGEVIEKLYSGDVTPRLPVLAHHFYQAAVTGDVDKAIRYQVLAGEREKKLLAYEAAAEHYSKALAALEQKADVDTLVRCELLLDLADAQTRSGSSAEGWENYQRAAELARKIDAAELFARAALGSGSWVIGVRYGSEDPVQIRLLQEALERVSPSAHAMRTKLLSQLALASYHVPSERLRLTQQALQVARRTDDPAARIAALFSRSVCLEGYEDGGQRLQAANEIIGIAMASGNKEMELRGRYRRFRELFELADLEAAYEEIEIYAVLAEKLRQPTHQLLTPLARAWRALLEGRFADCEQLLEQARVIGERAEDPTGRLFVGVGTTTLRRLQGRSTEILPMVAGFVSKYPALPGWRATLAQIYCEAGRPDDARRELNSLAENDFATVTRHGAWVVAMCLLAQVCWNLNEPQVAAELYDVLLPFSERLIIIGSAAACYGPVARHLALAAATMRRWPEAERHFCSALDMDRAMNARPFTAYTQLEYAFMLASRDGPGDRQHAASLSREAVQTAVELDLREVIAKGKSLLGRL